MLRLWNVLRNLPAQTPVLASFKKSVDSFRFFRNGDGMVTRRSFFRLLAASALASLVPLKSIISRLQHEKAMHELATDLSKPGALWRYRGTYDPAFPLEPDFTCMRPRSEGMNEIQFGIELDEFRNPVAAHYVLNRHPGDKSFA